MRKKADSIPDNCFIVDGNEFWIGDLLANLSDPELIVLCDQVIKTVTLRGVKIPLLKKSINRKKQFMEAVKSEIERIFYLNEYNEQLIQVTLDLFTELRVILNIRSKYRRIENLIPISIYLCFKLNSVPLNESNLLQSTKLIKKDFVSFKSQLNRYILKLK